MRNSNYRNWSILMIVVSIVAVTYCALNLATAQDQSKDVFPAEAKVQTNPKRTKRQGPVILRAPKTFVAKPPPAGLEYAQLGVTLWRVDSGNSKGIEQEGTEQSQERLDTNAAYREGDTFRLNVISPTGGYLYIVDQEQFADKSVGPAVLVFPTTTLRKGNNLIQAWDSIQIPGYPSVWRFRPRTLKPGEDRKPQTAELLTIIISRTPLVSTDRITNKQLTLNKGEFESWQAKYQADTRQFEMKNGAGQTVEARSKGVDQEGTEATTEEELDAQTTYQVAIRPGSPVLVTVPLAFSSTIKPPTSPVAPATVPPN